MLSHYLVISDGLILVREELFVNLATKLTALGNYFSGITWLAFIKHNALFNLFSVLNISNFEKEL